MNYNDLLKNSLYIKRPSKGEAFDIVRRVAHGEALLENDITSLLSYFQPPAPKAAEGWKWVAQAVAHKNDVREYLRFMYSRNGFLYGTDGHRAHRMPTTWDDGFYHPATCEPVDLDRYEYPDVDRVIFNQLPGVGIDPDTLPTCEPAKKVIAVELPGGVWVNRKYLLQAHGPDARYSIRSPTESFRIDHPDGRVAVIMPIRV
jgi:hypothetical protein